MQIVGRKGRLATCARRASAPETTLEQLAKLKRRSAGRRHYCGASGVNDGAAARSSPANSRPLSEGSRRGRVLAMATAGVEPRLMGLGPVPAVRKVLGGRDSILTIWI